MSSDICKKDTNSFVGHFVGHVDSVWTIWKGAELSTNEVQQAL
jgi:hypothetical protein